MTDLFSAIMVVVTCFSIVELICHLIDKKVESDLKKIHGCDADCEYCPKYYTCYKRSDF